MALNSFSALKASVADWLNRTNLTTQIPDFITLFEAQLKRRVEVEYTQSIPFAISAETVALPSDCKNVLSLYFDDGIRQGEIETGTPEYIAGLQGRRINLTTGVPSYGAIVDNGTKIEFSPTPNQTYTAKLKYVVKLVALSDTATSNWVLNEHPDVYLWGTLMQAEKFLKNDPRVATWERELEKALAELKLFIERRKVANTLIQRPRRTIP